MFKNLKLKTLSTIFICLFSILGLFLASSDLFKIKNVALIQASWDHLQTERSDKALLESALRAAIGYGGMIHEFKNLILRKETIRIEAIHSDLGAAQAIIRMYDTLTINEKEESALKKISQTLMEYKAASSQALSLIKQNKTSMEIDAQVKIMDKEALTGLATLRSEVRKLSPLALTPTKGRLIADIRASLGYGGMIHQFKNLVLRGDLSKVALIRQNIQQAETSILRYGKMQLTEKEKQSLKNIELTILLYRMKLKEVVALINQKKASSDIDKIVFVDDTSALEGLVTLNREVTKQISNHNKRVTQSLKNVKKSLYT